MEEYGQCAHFITNNGCTKKRVPMDECPCSDYLDGYYVPNIKGTTKERIE